MNFFQEAKPLDQIIEIMSNVLQSYSSFFIEKNSWIIKFSSSCNAI